VHFDIAGPFDPSREGFDHLAVMKDDFSGISEVVPTKGRKSTVLALKNFIAQLERQTGKSVRFVRTDNGPELVSDDTEAWFKKKGIIHETTPPYSPEHNGAAEALVKIIKRMMKAMLEASGLGQAYWPEAAKYAAVIHMKTTVGKDGIAPWIKLTGRELGLKKMLAFGDMCWVHTPKARLPPRPGHVLATERASIGRILGQEVSSTGWIVLLEDGTIYHSADVKSAEGVELTSARVDKPYPERKEEEPAKYSPDLRARVEDDDGTFDRESDDDEKIEAEAKAKRQQAPRVKPSWTYEPITEDDDEGGPMGTDMVDGVRRSLRRGDRALLAMFEGDAAYAPPPPLDVCLASASLSAGLEHDDPKTVREAMAGPYAKEWRVAMDTELGKLRSMGTWSPSTLPKGRKRLTAKWVFKVKRDAAGNLVKFKARLVARGFLQVEGVDFDETFAPVGRATLLRILVALATGLDWELQQADVEGAYLNGYLDTPIYMAYPEGVPREGGDCLRLHRSLYGLKQSGRAWWEELKAGLESIGFKQLESEWGLYFRPPGKKGGFALLLVYVDDLVLAIKSKDDAEAVWYDIGQMWTITKLGDVSTILGVQVMRDRKSKIAHLSQPGYIDKIVDKFPSSWLDRKTMPRAPLTKDHEDEKKDEPWAELSPYQQVVGCVQWLATMTRPDISYTAGALARKLVQPTETDWQRALRVVAYLKGTATHGLLFKHKFDPAGPHLEGFVDADWAGDVETRKSTTGYIFKLDGCPVSWYSRLQGCVAQSTVEAEYVALAEATKEAMWLRGLLAELGVSIDGPTTIHCDNQGAVKLAFKPAGHGRTKHIDTRYHLVRHVVREGVVHLEYIRTEEQPADILTKSLAGPRHVELTEKINVTPENILSTIFGAIANSSPSPPAGPQGPPARREKASPNRSHAMTQGAQGPGPRTTSHRSKKRHEKQRAHTGAQHRGNPKWSRSTDTATVALATAASDAATPAATPLRRSHTPQQSARHGKGFGWKSGGRGDYSPL
jgi:hypothetical protein